MIKSLVILICCYKFFGSLAEPEVEVEIMTSTEEAFKAKKASVLVVGAGISGLVAAKTLIQRGFDNVIVMEADKTAGGRVKSGRFGSDNIRIEYGAQWLHCINKNPLFKELVDHGLMDEEIMRNKNKYKEPDNDYFDYFEFIDSEGGALNNDEFRKSLETLDYLYQRIFTNPSGIGIPKNVTDTDSYGKCVNAAFKVWCDKKAGGDKEKIAFYKRANAVVTGYQRFDAGTSYLEDVSVSGTDEYEESGGDLQPPLTDGFTSLINGWINQIGHKRLLLGREVTQIDYSNDDEVIVNYRENGEIFTRRFDHVILTSPLSYLQKHYQTLFKPSLSQEKIKALTSEVRQGFVEKIFIELNEPITFPNVDAKFPLGFSIVLPAENSDKVTDELFLGEKTFYNLHQSGKYFVTAFIGDVGKKATEMDNEKLKTILQNLLRKALKKESLKIVNIDKSNWNGNNFILGSYTHILPKASEEVIDIIAEPLYDDEEESPLVMFAGEHTSKTAFSSMHGAYATGKREAQRLNKLYS